MAMKAIQMILLVIVLLQIKDGVECSCGKQLVGGLGIARYDYYRIYHVELSTREHVSLFQKLEEKSDCYTFYGHAREPGQKLSILVAAHKIAEFTDILKTYNVKHRILTRNFQDKIDKNMMEVLPIEVELGKFDWQHYFHLETIYKWMDNLAKIHCNDVSILNIGISTKGLPIRGLKIARNTNNKAIFIESGIHAREWIAPATATYIIDQLLTSTDRKIQTLANEFNWIIIPVLNPDGYKYTFERDRMWRKNRQLFGVCHGVDLNRNFPYHWNTTGTSGDPCQYDYSGPAAGSEIETKVLMEYIKQNIELENIKTYLSLHSYSQMIMFPYSYTAERVNNYNDLSAIAKKAADKIKSVSGRVYKSGSIHETIYPSSGGSKDWVHGDMRIPVTFTFELRGPPDSEDLFILPANEIQPTAEETLAAIVTIIQEAKARGYYK